MENKMSVCVHVENTHVYKPMQILSINNHSSVLSTV